MRPITLLFIATVMLSSCASGPSKALSKQETTDLLGPNASSSISWEKVAGPDFNVYHGYPKPPLLGEVGFYVGGHPSFQADAGSTKHAGHLGDYKTTWHRKSRANGTIYQTALFPLIEMTKIHAWVSAHNAADLDTLTRDLGALRIFSKRGSTTR